MNKNIKTLVILILILLVPVLSVLGVNLQDGPVSTEFIIKAYKNTPDPVLMKIYDAFSAELNDVKAGTEINVYSKMGSFLTDDLTKIADYQNQVIFSFQVSGASTGAFDLDITISPFVGPYVKENDTEKLAANPLSVTSFFKLHDVSFRFKTGQTISSNGYYDIVNNPVVNDKSPGSTAKGAKDIAQNTNANLKVHWDVGLIDPANANNDLASAIGEIWLVEGAVCMAVKKSTPNGYDDLAKRAGRYKSEVTVKLTYI